MKVTETDSCRMGELWPDVQCQQCDMSEVCCLQNKHCGLGCQGEICTVYESN